MAPSQSRWLKRTARGGLSGTGARTGMRSSVAGSGSEGAGNHGRSGEQHVFASDQEPLRYDGSDVSRERQRLFCAGRSDLGRPWPLFGERCTLCHSGPGAPSGLHLDSYQGAVKGSQNGPVLVPGDPDGSELIRRARRISQRQMPLVGPWFSSVPQDRPSHSSLQRNGAAISIHEHRGPDRLLLGPGHRPKGRLRGGRDVPSRVLLVRVIDRLEAL
jgi:hypothetical protein